MVSTFKPFINPEGDTWILTYHSQKVNPFFPMVNSLYIEDIAHALSNICRFNGHTSEFYSVAQHGVHVSEICDRKDMLWGLLHDAPEAYIADLARPIKYANAMKIYRDIESELMKAVCERFYLVPTIPESVRRADEVALATEVRDLMPMEAKEWKFSVAADQHSIIPLPPGKAKAQFLGRYEELLERNVRLTK